jgi:AraC-like DNA-binding protein
MPAGWAALVKEDGYDWLDDGFDARELLGDAVMQVWRHMRDASSFEERLKITQAYADTLFPQLDEGPDQFVRAVNAWLMESGSPDVDTLVAATGLSARQVERLTKRYYGLPPKQLARKYRALRAAGMLATGEAFDSSDLADAFYDQSHLTRELKQFTGLTPGQLKKKPPELLSLTMRARKAMRKKISPLISDT